ncbi:hypothetical protein [Geobacter sulfurreducens]|jgi:hypothetical protein|uniref:OmpA-like domain-containing protein n=1 Tax=Geobacter sulfurreducens (strain ATCC 51573 / DSM 12127 / PCA) TaxID=243231 RepID=Q74CD0_GEOSL|nr:hypothetical protein [Geobacter sulfurreducens]AAR35121.1 hypothetical protein GSU1744 [Geobacter sulfurreducens PCA]ADI84581.2 hypothetical protein KN400_1769 [Geobacter sulfurreducens KN400]AJY71248.1 hypothetical protein RW64_17665 [Geobacter sulfurreducens]UAC05739.1 hypothetical protein KVP06_08735 [Geobacter sulfurreducens]UTG91211.1 hypothetical protein J8622_09135 [Geobacter sulfurreducens]
MRRLIPACLVIALGVLTGAPAFAAEKQPREEVAFIRSSGETFSLDRSVRKQLDAAAARVAARDGRRIIMIEGGARRGGSDEERARNSLNLAMMAEKYLRRSHSLSRDILLAAAPEPTGKGREFIRILTLPDDFTAVHVSRAGTSSQP